MSILDTRCWMLDDKTRFFPVLMQNRGSRIEHRFFASVYEAKIIAVPRCRDTLARRVRPGFIRAGGDALLAQLAHVPVLSVDRVPKLNRIIGFKIAAFERFRIEQPITEDHRLLR